MVLEALVQTLPCSKSISKFANELLAGRHVTFMYILTYVYAMTCGSIFNSMEIKSYHADTNTSLLIHNAQDDTVEMSEFRRGEKEEKNQNFKIRKRLLITS